MAADLTVDAHLEFSVEIPGSAPLTGVLTGSGKALELRVTQPLLFAGRSDAGKVRRLAQGLADHGLLLSVIGPLGPVARLGVARTSWWQRRLTGSPHIRVERGAPLWSLVRGRHRPSTAGVFTAGGLAPPPTLFPIAPTMRRRPRRPVTTTHDPRGGGNPRMIMAPRPHPGPHDRQLVFSLRDDITTIGSAETCDIRLPRLEPLHAEIRHDADDEFVLTRIASPGSTRVHGAAVDSARLRTASRVEVGEWTMSFYREEFADHGRPYGGRIGGELGHQRPQPEGLRRRVGGEER